MVGFLILENEIEGFSSDLHQWQLGGTVTRDIYSWQRHAHLRILNAWPLKNSIFLF
jgi:hypothetical protein